jgi:hypothetical protein
MVPQENKYPLLNRHPEVKELFFLFRDMLQDIQRPPDQTVLGDEDVMQMLKISKRTLATMKAERVIPYSQERKGMPCRFLLSDILDYINKHRIESYENQRKI